MLKLCLILPVKFTFYILDILVPKDQNLILLASRSGKVKNANIDELARVLNGQTSFDYYFVSKKNEKRQLNYLSLVGLWKVLRAKFVFITHGPGDILYAFYSPRKVVTYVGHGIPLKSFIFTNLKMKGKEKVLQELEVPTYDYVVASSVSDQERLMKCFRKTRDEVIITGLPRNDLFGRVKKNSSSMKKILYAPTYRDNQNFKLFPFEDFDMAELHLFLKEINSEIFLRLHINDVNKVELFGYDNIHFLGHKDVEEIHEFLPEVDLLISDYSSIYLDYLLLDRPIIFLCYDKEEYIEMRGMLYDYDEVSPGHKPVDFSGFKKSIKESFSCDEFLDERAVVRKIFHTYSDGNSERLLKKVLEIK